MKRLRLPGWVSWYMLIWLSMAVTPRGRGKVGLNWFMALTSWTYGILGLELGLWWWAGMTDRAYWEPFQLAVAAVTGVGLCLVGLVVGLWIGGSCYRVVSTPPPPTPPPSVDAYPVDPRRESEKIALPAAVRPETVQRLVWLRVLTMLAVSGLVAITAGRSFLQMAAMPRLEMSTRQLEAKPVNGWVRVPLDGNFEVSMPERPERLGDWMIFENESCRLGVCCVPVPADQMAWPWRLWGGLLLGLGDPAEVVSVWSCQQSGLQGKQVSYGPQPVVSRILLGPQRCYSLSAVSSGAGEPTVEKFLNSFLAISLAGGLPVDPPTPDRSCPQTRAQVSWRVLAGVHKL